MLVGVEMREEREDCRFGEVAEQIRETSVKLRYVMPISNHS